MLKHHGVWGVKPLIAFIDKTLRYVIISFLAIPQNWLLTSIRHQFIANSIPNFIERFTVLVEFAIKILL